MMNQTEHAKDFIAMAMAKKEELPTVEEELIPLAEAIAAMDGLKEVRPEHICEAVAYLIPERRAELCTPRQEVRTTGAVRVLGGPGNPSYERMATVFSKAGLYLACCPVYRSPAFAAFVNKPRLQAADTLWEASVTSECKAMPYFVTRYVNGGLQQTAKTPTGRIRRFRTLEAAQKAAATMNRTNH